LKEALGRDAERLLFADMRLLARNPARMIPAWHQFLEKNAPEGRPARGIGELIWPGRSRAEVTECQRDESLLNLAFEDGQAWRLLCTYDLDGLDEQVIQAAQQSHPFIAQDRGSRRSDSYAHPYEALGRFDGPLARAPADAEQLAFTCEGLTILRGFVARWAAEASLDGERSGLLVLAVNELATNSVLHGGGSGTLRMWMEEETLLCEVHDSGRIEEPLAGRARPAPDQQSGHGLWLVNHLCDLVQIRSTPTGNVVRIHMRLV
jgi:anti-sigma regulatory factor (Ser/Thr protein kinase)